MLVQLLCAEHMVVTSPILGCLLECRKANDPCRRLRGIRIFYARSCLDHSKEVCPSLDGHAHLSRWLSVIRRRLESSLASIQLLTVGSYDCPRYSLSLDMPESREDLMTSRSISVQLETLSDRCTGMTTTITDLEDATADSATDPAAGLHTNF